MSGRLGGVVIADHCMSAQAASSPAIDDIFPSFAHPFPGPDDSILQLITLQCAFLSLSRAFEYHGDFILRQSPGLREVLDLWVARRQNALWEPLLARLREISATHPPEACYLALIESGLRAHFDGIVGSWVFRLAAPTRIHLGPWVLPSAIGGRVEAVPDRGISLNLQDEDGSTHRLDFQQTDGANFWTVAASSSSAIELPAVLIADSRIILLPEDVVSERLLPNLPGARFLAVRELAEVADRARRAADVISRHSLDYISWVNRAITHLAPYNSPNQGSSSHPSFPGLIVMSDDPRPSAIAEMLVHEASHQYFFMATLLGPVDDGSDAQQYYSPLVGCARPIDKVLLSFHALGNMMLLFRSCIASGIEDGGYCRQRLTSITAQAQQVEDALRRTTSLTQLGKALWEPLAWCLARNAA
jgi:hypothetical protein